ncbi:hypothetical protein [Roseivivax sp. CAU 1761]
MLPLLAGLPVICVAAGFGAGLLLDPAPDTAEPPLRSAEAPRAAPAPAAAPARQPDIVAEADAPATPDSGAEAAPVPEADARAMEAPLMQPVDPQIAGRVVHVGRMTIPVRRARSTSYIVADFGVAMKDAETAASFSTPDHTIRLRDALLERLSESVTAGTLGGVSLDTEALSADLRAALSQRYAEVEDVLFLSFYKADVPHV